MKGLDFPKKNRYFFFLARMCSGYGHALALNV